MIGISRSVNNFANMLGKNRPTCPKPLGNGKIWDLGIGTKFVHFHHSNHLGTARGGGVTTKLLEESRWAEKKLLNCFNKRITEKNIDVLKGLVQQVKIEEDIAKYLLNSLKSRGMEPLPKVKKGASLILRAYLHEDLELVDEQAFASTIQKLSAEEVRDLLDIQGPILEKFRKSIIREKYLAIYEGGMGGKTTALLHKKLQQLKKLGLLHIITDLGRGGSYLKAHKKPERKLVEIDRRIRKILEYLGLFGIEKEKGKEILRERPEINRQVLASLEDIIRMCQRKSLDASNFTNIVEAYLTGFLTLSQTKKLVASNLKKDSPQESKKLEEIKREREQFLTEAWEDGLLEIGEKLEEAGYYEEALTAYKEILDKTRCRELRSELRERVLMCEVGVAWVEVKPLVEKLGEIKEGLERARVLGRRLKGMEARRAANTLDRIYKGISLSELSRKALGMVEADLPMSEDEVDKIEGKYMEEVIKTIGYEKIGEIMNVMAKAKEYRHFAITRILFKTGTQIAQEVFGRVKPSSRQSFLTEARKYGGAIGKKAKELEELLK